ncbi:MAG TPA: outer membrane protein assembly factor BamA [Candidatus Acidoferrum sp.]|nr:outer membrane protein assembly factor BamA [Candidatus Acidoferrum sp.]
MSLGGWPVRVAQVVALAFLFASASGAFARGNLCVASPSAASSSNDSSSNKVLFSASLNLVTGQEAVEDHAQSASQAAPAQQPPAGQRQFIIERIEFIGNRRIRTDTLKARIFSREGDPYNEETLRRDFQALWNTQFFEDVKLRVEDSPKRPDGKIIVFEVRERPQIRRIRYEGMHSISESDILDRFKERKVPLSVESQFDPTKIKKAEVVIKELLGEHGRQFAKVTPQYERIASSNAVILVFKIDEGPKVKVGKIKFKGNHAFSDRKLMRAMRHDRPYSIPLYFWYIPVLSKTYDRGKLSEDLEAGVRELYRSSGYYKVSVGEPILENVETTHPRLGVPLVTGKGQGKAVNITIPIEEGERFRMGTLKIVSSDPDKALSLKVDALKTAFPLKQGDIFSTEKVRKALETYGKIYGEYGFIDFTPEPDTDVDDANKIINLTLRFDEQKQYYVRRIDFGGNTTTRDKVIRREMMIDEGQLFNKRLWEMSILRLNQLDYFNKIEADKDAEIKRNNKAGTVDITLKLKEKGKQSIGLQGGVSGLAGSFIGLTYQTNNFLGLGETLTFSAQFGSLTRTFMFGFTEPYLFDRPISTGFTVFSSRYNFDQARQEAILFQQSVSINPQYVQNYVQNSTGFTFFAQYPLRKLSFARFGLNYGLTRTNIKSFNTASSLLFESLQFRSLTGPSALNGIISSTITPSISYNTVDNPINSTHGKSFYYSVGFSGLGGNVKTITNVIDMKYFHPINKHRNTIGLHFSAAHTTGYAGEEVPPFSRFYMGGESDIRGYDIRAISPVTFIPQSVNTTLSYHSPSCLGGVCNFNVPTLLYVATLPGGDLQGYSNIEYRIPIVGNIVQASLFLDTGTVGILNRSALQLNEAGFQSLIDPTKALPTSPALPNAILPPPLGSGLTRQLAIAPNTNFRLRGSTGIEFVVQLPIIQAPFRVYYAYNVHRLYQEVTAKPPYIDYTEICEPAGTPGALVTCPNPGQVGTLPSEFKGVVWDSWRQFLNEHVLHNPGSLNYFEPKTTFRFTVSRTF